MDHLEQDGRGSRHAATRHVAVRLGIAALLSLVLVAWAGMPALADDTGPTTTTEPAPDTTPPDTTPPDTTPPDTTPPDTTPPSDTTPPTDTTPPATTTPTDPGTDAPGPPSSTDPGTTTTEPPSTTTTVPGDQPLLLPAELLVPVPEFGALTAHQTALVEQIQRATDAYALHVYARVVLAHRLEVANGELSAARAAEARAATAELLRLADFGSGDRPPAASGHGRARRRPGDDLDALRAVQRQLEGDRRSARRARVHAESVVSDLSAQLARETQATTDATDDRKAAESAIEAELGPDAVRARPDAITATLAAAQAAQPDPIVLGGLEPPIPGAPLASPFGLRNDPLSGGAGFHPGLDFGAAAGTPIAAAADGVVVVAGDCGGYGNCVVVDHGVSVATLYGHQSQVAVSVGQHVTAGQVIGYVGSTGLSTGPHLHFEVRLHGLPVDPLLALAPS